MPPSWVVVVSCLTVLRALCLEGGRDGNEVQDVTDEDLLQLLPLRGLTHLALGNMRRVSAPGVVALVESLSELQLLEVSDMPRSQMQSEVLVQGLLPRVVPRLACLKLSCMQHLSGGVRDALQAAAGAHGCLLQSIPQRFAL
jgi:hypothetical protein